MAERYLINTQSVWNKDKTPGLYDYFIKIGSAQNTFCFESKWYNFKQCRKGY